MQNFALDPLRGVFVVLAAWGIALSLTVPARSADIASMRAAYERSPAQPLGNTQLVDLGRLLFWDPRISASGKTACADCHFPHLGWSVTDPRSRGDSGRMSTRRSQPLIGVGHWNGPFGWDGRNPTLEAQAKNSILTGSMSMQGTDSPVKADVIEQRIRNITRYREIFERVLPADGISIDTIARAIAAYERTMEPGPAPFDRWVAGEESAISEAAKQGFVLFNTKANCFACHSTWRFTDDRFHDIGTSTTDRGRGAVVKDELDMQFAFKTPTLRSVALRPPYMHNASRLTLEETVRHYEKGGIDRPSRSPEMFAIQLTDTERLSLVAFMETLSGMPEGEPRPDLP